MRESSVLQRIKLASAQIGCTLLRNNSGAATDSTGRLIRYGLGNESERLNNELKSGDLVGWTPLLITQADVGRTVAIFTNCECKSIDTGWRGKPRNKREHAQKAFIDLVIKNGGIAGFTASELDLYRMVARSSGENLATFQRGVQISTVYGCCKVVPSIDLIVRRSHTISLSAVAAPVNFTIIPTFVVTAAVPIAKVS